MYWANFLHLYQPHSQTPDIVRRVTEESYRKIAQEVALRPNAKLTLNISGCLTDLLAKLGYGDVITSYRELLEKGQIELVESAMYHPFLPKLTPAEIRRQITLNHTTNALHFGEAYRPQGFFAPEMVYTPELGKIVADMGYKWMLLDEASFPGEFMPSGTIYESNEIPGFYLFFRHRNSSFKILSAQIATVDELIHDPELRGDDQGYIITGMDGETFGHHRHGLEKLLGQLLESLPTTTISQLFDQFPLREKVTAQTGTWALLSMTEVRSAPFSRWYSPDNEIHRLQWELVQLVSELNASHPNEQSQAMFDRAVHSDQFWWASAKPWWNIDMIGQGATELLDAALMNSGISSSQKAEAERLFRDILRTAFHWRSTGKVDELVRQHNDEEAKYRIHSGLTGMPKERLQKLIADLQRQMDMAVAAGEYNRAADFKRRIAELSAESENIFG